jgi:hypothetical protein
MALISQTWTYGGIPIAVGNPELVGTHPEYRGRGQPTTAPRAGASFPNLTFVQLLFGYRSLDELRYAFPDCIVRTEDAGVLLRILFPQQPSNVWPLL